MIEIKTIFNNNSVLVNIGGEREAIIMGKGIGYKKNREDFLNANQIQKVFYLDTSDEKKTFHTLLQNIPLDLVLLVYEIIDHAVAKYQFKVYDYAYLTLSEHLYSVYQQTLNGKYQPNLIPDLQQQYPVETQIASDALALINQKLKVNFPSEEIKSIALHFINAHDQAFNPQEIAQNSDHNPKVIQNKLIDVIIKDLDQRGIFRTAQNSNSFNRFMAHLRFLGERISHASENKDDFDSDFEHKLIKMYPQSYHIAKEIFGKLKKIFNYQVSNAELIYFIIHIQRIISETSVTSKENKHGN